MKKFFLFSVIATMLCSCANDKTFQRGDGTTFTAEPYGWMNGGNKIDGVKYDICVPNIVLSIVFGETVAAPVLLTGLELYEPVSYNEPDKRRKE